MKPNNFEMVDLNTVPAWEKHQCPEKEPYRLLMVQKIKDIGFIYGFKFLKITMAAQETEV